MAGNTGGDVAGSPHHQFIAGEFGVQFADLPADLCDGFQQVAHADTSSAAESAETSLCGAAPAAGPNDGLAAR
ncbi:hypothetical protein D3C84_1218670 [compost metagenome]